MKKFFLLVLCLFFICFSAQARYVRKVREPDFFIPEQFKMHQQEKLPAVNVKFTEKTKIRKKETEKFTEVPEYKEKYGEYLEDIKIFSKEGLMPENVKLENDLNLMSEGTVFEVTASAPENIVTKEHKKFEDIVDNILKN